MEETWSPGTIDFVTALWKCVAVPTLGRDCNNLTPSHSKTRPGNLLIPNWVMGRTAVLDASSLRLIHKSYWKATAATLATEARKHEERKHDPKSSELGWVCISVVAESYGAWGNEAMHLFSLSSKPTCKSVTMNDIYCRLMRNHVFCP